MLAAGTQVGPYTILAPLGARGMGEVYRAEDTRLGRPVALKVLPARFTTDPDRVHRFETGVPHALFEFRSGGGIPITPNTVTADGQRFLLSTLVDESGRAPLTMVVNWTAELKR